MRPATITLSFDVGDNVPSLKVSPDGDHLYLRNWNEIDIVGGSGQANVTVIDTATNTVTATILTGDASDPFAWWRDELGGLAVSPDGRHVYTTDLYLDDLNGTFVSAVTVIDTDTNTVTTTIPTGNFTGSRHYPTGVSDGVVVSPDGRYVYAMGNADGHPPVLKVIDTRSNVVIATVDTPTPDFNDIYTYADVVDIAISPDGSHLHTVGGYDYWDDQTSRGDGQGILKVIDTARIAFPAPADPPPTPPADDSVPPPSYAARDLAQNLQAVGGHSPDALRIDEVVGADQDQR